MQYPNTTQDPQSKNFNPIINLQPSLSKVQDKRGRSQGKSRKNDDMGGQEGEKLF